jgi:hypothetical protein
MVVTGTHDPYLVAPSILVASFASFTALDLSGHVGAARGRARRVWLVAAAITMGGGIWSMLFIGMLAFVGVMHGGNAKSHEDATENEAKRRYATKIATRSERVVSPMS